MTTLQYDMSKTLSHKHPILTRDTNYNITHHLSHSKHDPHALTVLTAEFCNNVLGIEASKRAERFQLGNKLLTLRHAAAIVLREHYVSAAWMFSSLLRTRVQRFMEAFKTLLLALFIDTLIFGIFYPSDGKCETYQTKQTCLTPQAKLGGNQCTWDRDKQASIYCTPVEPPGNIISVLILALVITILIRPAMILIEVISSACEYRPRFESWSKQWNTNSWLGSLHHASYLDYSPLAMAFVHHDKTKTIQEQNVVPVKRASNIVTSEKMTLMEHGTFRLALLLLLLLLLIYHTLIQTISAY